MTTQTLHQKIDRYLCGASMPAETRQIQNWLSCTERNKGEITEEDKSVIESDILESIKIYTAYPLFYPQSAPWWKKITAFF